MTEATIYERLSGIRGELLDLISSVGTRGAERDLRSDLMLDELMDAANGLGRVAENLDHPVIDLSRAVSKAS